MTVQKSDPLNANGVPLPAAEVQVLKNGLPSTLPDIDVRPNFTTTGRSLLFYMYTLR
jgi:hypothetical protein